jgi:hypothetical protein
MIELRDFTPEQVETLAAIHGLAWSQEDLGRLMGLVGGHPFLLRRVMHEAMASGQPLAALIGDPANIEHLFGAHLHGIVRRLESDPKLGGTLRRVLADPLSKVHEETYQHLRSLGILLRRGGSGYHLRYRLYQEYLERRWSKG